MSKLDDIFDIWYTEAEVGPDGTVDNHEELVTKAQKQIKELMLLIGKESMDSFAFVNFKRKVDEL